MNLMINLINNIKKYFNIYLYKNLNLLIRKILPIIILYYLIYICNNYWFKLYPVNFLYIIIILLLTLFTLFYKIYLLYYNYYIYNSLLDNITKNLKLYYINYALSLNLVQNIKTQNTNSINYNSNDNIIDIYDSDQYLSDNDIEDSKYIINEYNDNLIYQNELKKYNLLYIKELLVLYITYIINLYNNKKDGKINYNKDFYKYENFINNEIRKLYHNININKEQFNLEYLNYLIIKHLYLSFNTLHIISISNYKILYKINNELYTDILNFYKMIIIKNNLYTLFNIFYNLIYYINAINLIIYFLIINLEYGIIYILILFCLLLIFEIISNKNYEIYNINDYLINLLDEIFIFHNFYLQNIQYNIN